MFKSYNIRYYWRIFWIWRKRDYRLTKLWFAGKLLKLVNKLSPELMREYDSTVIRTKQHVKF